jgi:hypothetical protein
MAVCILLQSSMFRSFQLNYLSDALGRASSFHLYSTVSEFITWHPTLLPEYMSSRLYCRVSNFIIQLQQQRRRVDLTSL